MCPSDLEMKAIKDEYSLYCTGEIKNCLIALQVIVKEKECGEMFLWDPQVQSREDQELSWLCSINTPTSGRRWSVLWLSEVCKIVQLRPKQHKIHLRNGGQKVGRRAEEHQEQLLSFVRFSQLCGGQPLTPGQVQQTSVIPLVRAIAWLLPVHCFLTAACKHYRSTLEFHYLICCTGVTQPGIWALYHIISSTAIFAGLLWERRNALACSKGECEQRHTVKQAVLGASSWRLAWGSAASDLGTESSPAAGVL